MSKNPTNENNKTSFLPILKTTAAVGLTGIGFLLTGVYIPETIVGTAIGGIGGGMLSRNFEKGMEGAFSWMTQGVASNHDLQKAFGRSLVKACTTLEEEYERQSEYKRLSKRHQTSIQVFFKNLRQTTEKEIVNIHPKSDWFKDKDLQKYLNASSNSAEAEADLQSKLKAYRYLENGFQPHFVEFVKINFSKAIQFHFIEILKDNQKDNTKVWRAYQLQLQQNLQKILVEIRQQQKTDETKWEQLTERLAAMSTVEPQKADYSQIVSAELLLGFGRHFQVLEKQLTELQKEVKSIAAKQGVHIDISKKILEEVKAIPKESPSSPIPKYLSTLPPLPPKNFLGRENDLKEVHKMLQNKVHVVLVNGIGGIGKTTLAQAYWQKHQEEYDFLAWFTLLPESDLTASVLNSSLEESFDIQLQEGQKMEERFLRVWQKLVNLQGKKLLVFDNANDTKNLSTHNFHIPKAHILLTSRSRVSRFEEYSIGVLLLSKAKELFCRFYPAAKSDSQTELLEKLLKAIGLHTLTIELLAKNLQKLRGKGYGLQDLYDNLKERGLLKPDKSRKIRTEYTQGEQGKYEEIIAAMFDIQPLSEYEQWLLLQFAVLPAIFISYVDMYDFLQIEEETEDEFDETLIGLVEKGWLESKFDKKDKKAYKIHQVVQEVIRLKVKPNGENCNTLVNGLVKKIVFKLNNNPIKKKEYLKYAISLFKYLKKVKTYSIAELNNEVGACFIKV